LQEILDMAVAEFALDWDLHLIPQGDEGKTDRLRFRTWFINKIKYYSYHPHATRWQAFIEKHRQIWEESRGSRIRLAFKTARIEEYQKIHQKAMAVGDFQNARGSLKAIAEERGDIPKAGIEGVNVFGDVYQDNRQVNSSEVLVIDPGKYTEAELAVIMPYVYGARKRERGRVQSGVTGIPEEHKALNP